MATELDALRAKIHSLSVDDKCALLGDLADQLTGR
jgi:hypothetical protein